MTAIRQRCTMHLAPVIVGLLAALPALADDKPKAPIPLNAQKTVLLDKPGNRLLLKTKVVLREGQLEMLVCPKKTKEHESILAIDSKAINVHAGLLALGLKKGTTAKFDPKFVPPAGQELKITLHWKDRAGKSHSIDSRQWIHNATLRYFEQKLKSLPKDLKLPNPDKLPLRYDQRTKDLLWYGQMKKSQRDALLKLSSDKQYRAAIDAFFKRTQWRPMSAGWVFAGSGYEVNPATMKSRYLAEAGTLICVANFPGATIDVTEKSSASSGNELYEAWTERIPPIGTEVTVEIRPAAKKPTKKPAKSK